MGEPPELRPACRVEAMEGDTESQLVRNDVGDALAALRHPTVLVRAPRGLLDGDPLYAPAWVQQWVDQVGPLRAVDADDVNHYTVVISDAGAVQIAALVREEMASV